MMHEKLPCETCPVFPMCKSRLYNIGIVVNHYSDSYFVELLTRKCRILQLYLYCHNSSDSDLNVKRKIIAKYYGTYDRWREAYGSPRTFTFTL